MDVASILEAAAVVAVAEVGDKSQLAILALAARHGALRTWLGAVGAFAVLTVVAVGFGALLLDRLPEMWVTLGVGLGFVAVGGWQLLVVPPEDDPEDEEPPDAFLVERLPPALAVFVLVTLAELGDKTQVQTAALAPMFGPAETWLGAMLALAVLTTVAVVVGDGLHAVVPVVWIRRMAGLLFLGLGASWIWTALA